MSNLQIFDPLLARKSERKQKYCLWTIAIHQIDYSMVSTIDDARALWLKAKKSGEWKSWELFKGRNLIKKGEF